MTRYILPVAVLVATTVLAVGFILPMALASGAGAASQQALGTVVVGGMLASTLFAIPFVPVFYIAMQRLSERRAAKKEQAADARVLAPRKEPAE